MADVLIDTKTTDTGGQVNFADLPAGNYYYVMKTAPEGYNLDSTHYTFTVTDTTPIDQTREAEPTNTGTLTVVKHAAGLPLLRLAGGTFSLKKGTTVLVAESSPTGLAGTVSFPNLMTMTSPNEVTYAVQEVTQPVGFQLNTNAYDVPLEIAGSTQMVPDTALIAGAANVTLEDTYYDAVKLPDASPMNIDHYF